MNSFAVLVYLCLSACWLVQAQRSTHHNIYKLPRPVDSNTKCNTPTPSYLCDPDKLLSDEERQQLHLRLLKFEEDTKNPKMSDPCKAKGIRLSVLFTQIEVEIPTNLQPPKTVGELLYELWALDRECGKTAVIAFCNRTKKSSVAQGVQKLPIFTDEFAHVVGIEETFLTEGKILPAFMEITNNLQKIAVNRANLLGLRSNDSMKEVEECILGLHNLAAVLLIVLLGTTVVFAVLGWAYHAYWISKLKKRDEKNMVASWKTPSNGTQAVQSRFVSDERVINSPVKTPIPVIPF